MTLKTFNASQSSVLDIDYFIFLHNQNSRYEHPAPRFPMSRQHATVVLGTMMFSKMLAPFLLKAAVAPGGGRRDKLLIGSEKK